mmetsp:Transcript_124949/g.195788  ORF Transcript_124949/g.195788 Transcript_124949/m.195788 type:complete len:262 (+) Transcript_124949:144-929(+)
MDPNAGFGLASRPTAGLFTVVLGFGATGCLAAMGACRCCSCSSKRCRGSAPPAISGSIDFMAAAKLSKCLWAASELADAISRSFSAFTKSPLTTANSSFAWFSKLSSCALVCSMCFLCFAMRSSIAAISKFNLFVSLSPADTSECNRSWASWISSSTDSRISCTFASSDSNAPCRFSSSACASFSSCKAAACFSRAFLFRTTFLLSVFSNTLTSFSHSISSSIRLRYHFGFARSRSLPFLSNSCLMRCKKRKSMLFNSRFS